MATDSDGYETGEDSPAQADTSFSSLDDSGPMLESDEDSTLWDEEQFDLIVSSNGPHYCADCHPWEDDNAREYIRYLYKRRLETEMRKENMVENIAEMQAILPSIAPHEQHKKFARLRILRYRQFIYQLTFKKLSQLLREHARNYLLRMNGKR